MYVATERVLLVRLIEALLVLVINTCTVFTPDLVASDRLGLLNDRAALAKCSVVVPCNGTAILKVSFAAIVDGDTVILVRDRGIGLRTACVLTTAINFSEQ